MQWRDVVGVVPRLKRTSRDVRRGVSSRPQHPKVPQYFLHHHLWPWTMACSCKAWSRLRLQFKFPKTMAMVVRPSWRGLRGWLRLLLRGRVSPF
ncbi:hypothetical protein Taro_031790 [Colocasia esculenta]|uniref:Uncharacterized protein n=1 Tax=Colocasia esculenta TaxID=4460 RepID=A0A843W465_COLES|nr:hypothetical protein [Colocasia esculenta]